MKPLYRSASFAALVAASAIAASTQIAAADIVYFVNQTIAGASATGSVTGTITTNGTTGPSFFPNLDIVDFDLTISVAGQTSTLMDGVNGGAFFASAGSLTATPTELLFNFDNNGQFVNFFTNPTTTVCAPAWTVRSGGGNLCGIVSGTVNAAIAVPGGPIATVPGSGIETIAFVPGPIVGAGLPGLIAALGGLVAMARRRRKQLA